MKGSFPAELARRRGHGRSSVVAHRFVATPTPKPLFGRSRSASQWIAMADGSGPNGPTGIGVWVVLLAVSIGMSVLFLVTT